MRKRQFQRIARSDFGRAFLDHSEQNHRHDFIERFFHQDAGLDRGQSAFDAVTFNANARRDVLQFATLSLDRRKDGQSDKQEREKAYTRNTRRGC